MLIEREEVLGPHGDEPLGILVLPVSHYGELARICIPAGLLDCPRVLLVVMRELHPLVSLHLDVDSGQADNILSLKAVVLLPAPGTEISLHLQEIGELTLATLSLLT